MPAASCGEHAEFPSHSRVFVASYSRGFGAILAGGEAFFSENAAMNDVTETGNIIDVHASALPQSSVQPPSWWLLFRIWLGLGLQSFGGGAATLFLIRRTAVERQHWLTAEEFARDWSICFIAPGINLLAMTILIGYRVAGIVGSLISLVGLLLPSVTITIVLTAFYASFQHMAAVQAALRGIVPATIGLGLLLTVQMARPLLTASHLEGRVSWVVSLFLLAGSAAAAAFGQLPVFVVYCGAGVLAALFMWWRNQRKAHQP
jgi:chromate transporter